MIEETVRRIRAGSYALGTPFQAYQAYTVSDWRGAPTHLKAAIVRFHQAGLMEAQHEIQNGPQSKRILSDWRAAVVYEEAMIATFSTL